jgi:hypothetical protein
MREQENSTACAVATANGFAMPYRSAPDSALEDDPVYRVTTAPARERSPAARWWARLVGSRAEPATVLR